MFSLSQQIANLTCVDSFRRCSLTKFKYIWAKALVSIKVKSPLVVLLQFMSVLKFSIPNTGSISPRIRKTTKKLQLFYLYKVKMYES